MNTIECTKSTRQRRHATMKLTSALLLEAAGAERDPEQVAKRVTGGALHVWPKPNDRRDPFRAYFPEDMPGFMCGLLAMTWEHNCPRRVYVRVGADGRYTRQALLDGIASLLCYQLGDRGHPCGIRDVYDAVARFFAEAAKASR